MFLSFTGSYQEIGNSLSAARCSSVRTPSPDYAVASRPGVEAGGGGAGQTPTSAQVGSLFEEVRVRESLGRGVGGTNSRVFYMQSRNVHDIVAVLEELRARSSLSIAVKGRSDKDLEPLISFVSYYICDPLYTSLLTSVASEILGAILGKGVMCRAVRRDDRPELAH